MIFIDGIGLGPHDAERNPFVKAPMPFIRSLLNGVPLVQIDGERPTVVTERATLVAVDACVGVDGLPQSATGQTTLLTGVNASKTLGRHLSGWPTPTLVRILRSHSIFKQLKEIGLTGTFANPFTEQYFKQVERGRRRLSATTLALLSADWSPRMLDELEAGAAVFHDITGEGLRESGYDVTVVSPQKAGRRLARLTSQYDFTLFEHFLTDMAGHAQNWDESLRLLSLLDTFIGAVVRNVDLSSTLVIIVSDHGNMEDLSVKTHTRNPVPALLIGAGKDEVAANLSSLLDVTPALIQHLRGESSGE